MIAAYYEPGVVPGMWTSKGRAREMLDEPLDPPPTPASGSATRYAPRPPRSHSRPCLASIPGTTTLHSPRVHTPASRCLATLK